MSSPNPPAVMLMGPTASGKTEIAARLVRQLPFEIISVDSALVYRGMNIGTAKPDADLLQAAPHHLIDIRDPSEPYSAAEFREDARAVMAEITSRGRIPLLVGGTLLYFRALEEGLSDMPPADPAVRTRLDRELQQDGLEALHARLQQVDPPSAVRIHRNDPQRIQRALEVYDLTGQPLSALHAQGRTDALPYRWIKVILAPADRVRMRERIARRFHAMLDAGLIAEVKVLYERSDLPAELPAMRAVGYRQVWSWLAGQITYDEMINQAIVATRQYAKRQLTWLRAEEHAQWFAAEDPGAGAQIRKYLQQRLKQVK